MLNINPARIQRPWHGGFALDKHTASSELSHYNEYGRPRFNNIRTEIGEMIYQLKYQNNQSVLPVIIETVVHFIMNWKPQINCIIPVPPSKPRFYQPIFEIARGLSEQISIPLIENYIIKTKQTLELKNIEFSTDKIKALEEAYIINNGVPYHYGVLLFDDLYDTGATLSTLARLLYQSGKAKKIYALTLTRTRG